MNKMRFSKAEWFSGVLRTYEKSLLRYAFNKVPKDPAQDIVQECFLRLWKEDEAELSTREGPWLFAVTRNLCIDWLKTEGSRKTSPVEKVFLVDPAEPALQKMMQQQEESEILRKISALTESQQEVLRLKFQDGFSYKEISEITGHSISYVGVLIHEAMNILRAGLQAKNHKSQREVL